MAVIAGRGQSALTLSQGALDEEDEKKKKAQKKGGPAKEAGGGKSRGGSGLVGGIIEAGAGFVDRNAAKKAARRAENRPKRRRVAKGMEMAKSQKNKQDRVLATLSQSVYDWSSSVR